MSITQKRLHAASRIIGQRIAALRREAGLTQEELAERVGSSKNTISRVEMGHERASLQRLMEIADALKVDVREFFASLVDEGDPRDADIAEMVALLRRATPEEARRAVELVRVFLKR